MPPRHAHGASVEEKTSDLQDLLSWISAATDRAIKGIYMFGNDLLAVIIALASLDTRKTRKVNTILESFIFRNKSESGLPTPGY